MTEFWRGAKKTAEENVELLKNKLNEYVDPRHVPMVRAIVETLTEEEERAKIAEEELKKTPQHD